MVPVERGEIDQKQVEKICGCRVPRRRLKGVSKRSYADLRRRILAKKKATGKKQLGETKSQLMETMPTPDASLNRIVLKVTSVEKSSEHKRKSTGTPKKPGAARGGLGHKPACPENRAATTRSIRARFWTQEEIARLPGGGTTRLQAGEK